jgi:alanine-synthesizing transaminase
MVRETGVVVVHGSGFGQAMEHAHFRIVFAPPDEVLKKAYQRIGEWLAKRKG